MSSIDILKKVVVVTDNNFLGLTDRWISDLKDEGYEVKDFRKPVPEKRRASQDGV